MPDSEIQAPYREQLGPEDLLQRVREVLSRGQIIVVASDFDLTISASAQGEDDPRKTTVHPRSADALERIEDRGHRIGIISNRSGQQVAKMLIQEGIEDAIVVGTQGYETVLLEEDTSVIDKRFSPYSGEVTSILQSMRSGFLTSFDLKERIDDNTEIMIDLGAQGVIFIERKGVCQEFPEGLAQVYNLNAVVPSARGSVVNYLKNTFETTHISDELSKLWGVTSDPQSPEKEGRYSLSLGPIETAKQVGMTQLLRTVESEIGEDHEIGMIIYAGDHDQDAAAMLAQGVYALAAREMRSHPLYAFGIWVKPGGDQPQARKHSDIHLNGPDEYAQLLSKLVELIEQAEKPLTA